MTETLQRLQAAVLPRLRAFGASRALEAALAFLFAAAGSAGFAPLGPAAVAGAWLMGALPFPALFGAAAGALFAGHYAALAASALYVGGGLLFSVWRRRMHQAEKLALLGAAYLLLLPFFHGESAQDCLIGVAELTLACFAAIAFARGGAALAAFLAGRRLRGMDQAALLLFAALFAAALPCLTFVLPSGGPFGMEVTLYFGAAFAPCARGAQKALRQPCCWVRPVCCVAWTLRARVRCPLRCCWRQRCSARVNG